MTLTNQRAYILRAVFDMLFKKLCVQFKSGQHFKQIFTISTAVSLWHDASELFNVSQMHDLSVLF